MGEIDHRPRTAGLYRITHGAPNIYGEATRLNRLTPEAEAIYTRDDVTLYRVFRMIDPLRDLGAAIGDGRVWLALAIACGAGLLLTLLGSLIARRVGLLEVDADRAETVGVGLTVGLLALVAGWASVASSGRSVFVPVAVLLVLAVAVGRERRVTRVRLDRGAAAVALAAAAFLVVIGLLYATTIAPSPRDGYQPIEFFDTGYYSVLGADLADTGVESIYSPAGFDQLPGLPEQTWYHWGELWLAAAAIDLTGVAPLHARHLIALPLLLLAASTMVGVLVHRLVSRSREFYLLAAVATLFLAPIPLSADSHFASWARGLVFSITQYGLAANVLLLGIFLLASRRGILGSRAGILLVGAIAASLIATHISMAMVAAAAVAALTVPILCSLAWRTQAFRNGGMETGVWVRTGLSVILSCSVMLAWGLATGHALGGLDQMTGIHPFDPVWGQAVILTMIGAGVLLAAPVAWIALRRTHPVITKLASGSTLATMAGAIGWGLRVADLNTFHLFFGAIATMLTPAAIVAVLVAVGAARRRTRAMATVMIALLLAQTLASAVIVGLQLYRFGPGYDPPIATSTLAAIGRLPDGAKMAYSCTSYEVFAPWDSSLIAIDAHTRVRMVPMCYSADRQRELLDRPLDITLPNPFFTNAPQRVLYPNAGARPTPNEILRFLRLNRIDYVYSDGTHPNTLVSDAMPILTADDVSIYRLR